MRRRVFAIFSILSLLLWTAAAILCVRSNWVVDSVSHCESVSDTQLGLTSDRGRLSCQATHFRQRPGFWSEGWSSAPSRTSYPLPGGWTYLGFFIWRNPGPTQSTINLIVPYWFVLLLLAILPVRWLWLIRHPRAAQQGLCLHCGYDLRATPERCPECGTAVLGEAAKGATA